MTVRPPHLMTAEPTGSRFGDDLHSLLTAAAREQMYDDRFARLGDAAPRREHRPANDPAARVQAAIANARQGNDAGFFAAIIGDGHPDTLSLQERAPHVLRVPLQKAVTEARERGDNASADDLLAWVVATAHPNFARIVRDADALAPVKSSLKIGPDSAPTSSTQPNRPSTHAEANDDVVRPQKGPARGRVSMHEVTRAALTARHHNRQPSAAQPTEQFTPRAMSSAVGRHRRTPFYAVPAKFIKHLRGRLRSLRAQ